MRNMEELIRKYNSGECTAEERQLLEQWYHSFEWNNKISSAGVENIAKLKEEVWLAIQKSKGTSTPEKLSPAFSKSFAMQPWWRFAAVAAVVAAVAMISFLLATPKKELITTSHIEPAHPVIKQVKPGSSKAQLILANGNIISLDSPRNMLLKEEDGTLIDKQTGKLVYRDDAESNGKILFNTLSTPRGGEYRLELPDGSKVWLNAASSIKFPTRFEGKERAVFLHGEAYFEVAKNKAKPFIVKLDNDMTVEVVGTHFNIMGYNDESEIRTTLEEGIVKVTNENKTVLLSPSRQAVMKRGYESLTVSEADVSQALAWKNGMIEFDGNDLPYIMRQLSRWYDVEVSFTNGIPQGTYKGAIRRQAPLSDVLEILKLAGVDFKMDHNKLLVTGG